LIELKTPYELAVNQASDALLKNFNKKKHSWSSNSGEPLGYDLKAEDLAEYDKVDAERKVRPATDFTEGVLDFFMHGDQISGRKLPFTILDNKFRFRKEEVTVLGGINGSGKSLLANQWMLKAMDDGAVCLVISLEMSPKATLSRMWRQASLDVEPTLDFGLEFGAWTNGKMWFYDQQGSVDLRTLNAVIRWAKDHCSIDFVLIDSLMTLNIAEDDYNGQKKCITTLANLARELEMHIVLVCHAKKGNDIREKLTRWSIRGASSIADRADNIFLLGRTFDNDPMNADAYLTLAKARHFDGAECELDLWLDMASMNYHLANEQPEKLEMTDDN
jgi:twinkle protein